MAEHKNSVYRNISLDLLHKIENGEYPQGAKLPPERQLMTLYGVERLTVRRALEVLENDGIIIKKSGLGSFVADPKEAPSAKKENDDKEKKLSTPKSSFVPDFVVKPDLAAAADVLYHYLTERRHEKVAYIGSDPESFSALLGTFAKYRTPDLSDFVLTDAGVQVGKTFEAYWQSRRNGYPSAVIAANAAEAALLEEAAARLGLTVPEKLTVIALVSDERRYTGCTFDKACVKRMLSEAAWRLPEKAVPKASVLVAPRLFEGQTAAEKSENTRGRAMSDYLL